MGQDAAFLLRVSASFTAEPVEATLDFWMRSLEPDAVIEFAPFNQIFQSLLDPASLFATNRHGLNVVLIRWQDLGSNTQIAENGRQLIEALQQAAGRFAVPMLVAITPASPAFLAEPADAALVGQLDVELEQKLATARGIFVLNTAELNSLYPVANYDDPTSDRLGHVPYAAEFFTALGTAIARKAAAIRRTPYKVAVLDLDNTLWQGVAGEDGPSGVVIGPERIALQEFLIRQRESGMLLAICSKNNEDDALEVFRERREMPLRIDDFAATRINWEAKSNNLRSLSQELSLGLDSFIFIDDDDKECAEVRANCPEVLTLQLPADAREIPEFLRHVWAFDRVQVTKEDRQRSDSYRQERDRTQFEKQTSSLEDFIAGLQLRVTIEEMRPEQLPRVAQLTQRTNQFNTTTIRRNEGDVLNSGLACLTVDVSDRFGDYGLVGAVLYGAAAPLLTVDSFMLSCRALGRGVEHEIVRALGVRAEESGCEQIRFAFAPTPKNAPAKKFLDSLGASADYAVSAAQACALVYHPTESAAPATASQETSSSAGPAADYARIARELRSVEQIAAHIRADRPAASIAVTAEVPRNETERKLATIWAETLGVPSVGIHDDFFELGGYSLLAVELLRNIIETFGTEELTLSAILEAPSVAKFARLLEKGEEPSFSCLVPIRATGTRPPFYCVHGAGGNVVSLRAMAMNLPDDQPFWCLQAKGLDGSEPTSDLKETAALYIREIKTLQPEGPYLIGGGSYGGLFAYEMAQQFVAQGDQVALLAMFDTYNLAYGQMISKGHLAYCMARFFAQRAANQVKGLLRSPPSEWPRKLSFARRALGKHLGRFTSALGSGPRNESQPLPAGPETADGQDQTGLTDVLVRVRDATMRAAETYMPQPYSGKVALFTATVKMVEPYQDKYLGWGPLVKGELEVHEIVGDHVTFGDNPEVGHALNRVLKRVQAGMKPASRISTPEVQSVAG